MKVAIVHYWLVGMRGGEKVVEALCELYPEADIFTHAYRPDRISDVIRRHRVQTTFIGRLPFARTRYRSYLPLMPFALEQLDLTAYDLVISSESGPAKGVITRPGALHICYCHTPMRYVWSGYHSYRRRANPFVRMVMPPLLHRLRLWDAASAVRVDHFIANSQNVAERIWRYYRRDSTVIYPPVVMDTLDERVTREDFYLFVGELVSYKGADLAIDAFNRLMKPLVVIGRGSEFQKLKKRCGSTVKMLGWQDEASLRQHYRRCRALVFAADEDFGIVPVEAMSAGRPVIAYDAGGARETIVPGKTGILFREQTAEALAEAVLQFEREEESFDPAAIAAHAAHFAKDRFKERISAAIGQWLDEGRDKAAWRVARQNPATADAPLLPA
jgi:glycosyltransferase involved in cell wall biosynthesis